MYLLDTNVLSELSRHKPNPRIIEWLSSSREESLAVPFSAVIEIQRGIMNLREQKPEKADELDQWLRNILATDMPFLAMDAHTAMVYGTMTAVPALRDLWVPDPKSKRPKPGQDLAIAATAVAHQVPIVSLNLKDFLRINQWFRLPGLLDPISREWVIVPPAATAANCTLGDEKTTDSRRRSGPFTPSMSQQSSTPI